MTGLPRGDFLTASNLVSIARIGLIAPFMFFLLNGMMSPALLVVLAAAFTDWLDGYLARRTKTVSEWGMVLDPVADKLFVGVAVVTLVLLDLLPWWYVVAVVARDAAILLGGIHISKKHNLVLPSTLPGKLAVSAISLSGFLAILEWTVFRNIAILVACLLMVVSLLDYSWRYITVNRMSEDENISFK